MNTLVHLAAAYLIARLAVSGSIRLGLVDRPDQRKLHAGAVPLAGGIAIFVTVAFGVLFLGIAPYTREMMIIALGVFLVGVFDDKNHINPWLRLGIQYTAGVALTTYGGIAIYNVGNLLALGDIPLLILTVPLTALSMAGLSNAYNMIDGIDGLAGSVIALPCAVLYTLAASAGHPMAPFLGLILLPLAVYLVFNLGPNNRLLPKMFLGDGGSVTMGFFVTTSLVYFSQGENALILPVTALWLVTVPLMDMLATMLRRAKHGRKLMEADRSHLHHTLIDVLGFTPRQALFLLVTYAGACATLGLWLENIPEYLSLACYFALFCLHCLFVMRAGRRQAVTANP